MAEPRVVVTGVGHVQVVPDRVELTLGVAHETPTPGESFRRAADASRTLLGLLEEAGLPPEDRRTAGVAVHPSYDRGAPEPTGHEAQVTVVASCDDLEAAGDLLERASRALEGSLRVHGLAWVVADPTPVRAEASRAALAAALARAGELAEAAGTHLGRVLSIVEHPEVSTGGAHRLALASAGPAVEPGSQEVVVAVEVEVELGALASPG